MMFKNYFLTALRNIFRHKLYSLINIGGLAIGLAACILIFLFVRDELSFDGFLPDTEDTYLLRLTIHTPGYDAYTVYFTPAVMKPFIEQEFSEIEEMAKATPVGMNVRQGADLFAENLMAVDANFNRVLAYPVIEGDLDRVLSDNSSIAVSEAMVEKYFPGGSPADAMGQTITTIINNEVRDYRVGAVMKDLPDNSNQQFDFLLGLQEAFFPPNQFGPSIFENWTALAFNQYIRLAPGTDTGELLRRFPAMLDRIIPDAITNSIGVKPSDSYDFEFARLKDIHLDIDSFGLANSPPVDPKTLLTLTVIAVLILLIASINFMNLATARSSLRAREVAMRKTLGARRNDLVVQFLGEALMLTVVAMVVAALLVELVLPFYNEFVAKNIVTQYISQPLFLGALAGLAMVVSIGAGMYPAFHLSSFRPAQVLKSNQSSAQGSPLLRNLLVILQFSISIGLIIATTVVITQTRYARNVELAYDKENVLVVRGLGQTGYKVLNVFIDEMERHPSVVSVGHSTFVPSDGFNISTSVTPEGQPDAQMVGFVPVGWNFFETYGVEPIAGRLFEKDRSSDTAVRFGETSQLPEANTILTERAVGYMGYGSPQQALGKVFTAGINFKTNYTIVGVVPDIDFGNIRQEIRPAMYSVNENGGSFSIRYRADLADAELEGLLQFIDETWARMEPNQPVVRQFLDDNLDALYNADERLGSMMLVFAALAIVVSALGLFGLSSFTAELKTKEVGVRKTMGATVPELMRLLIWQFSKPVFVANLIAWPLSWYFLNEWLSGFALRISISPLYFIIAGLATLLMAWITVGGLVYRVAKNSPVHALRCE
jgi:putative ABC transport system permease protein